MIFHGSYFDGKTSRAMSATLEFRQGHFVLQLQDQGGDNSVTEYSKNQVLISSRIANTKRVFQLSALERFETAENDLADQLQSTLGARNIVDRLERNWRWVTGSVAVIISICLFGYFYVLPTAAKLIAPYISDQLIKKVSDQTKYSIKNIFSESTLNPYQEYQITHVKDQLSKLFPDKTFEITTIKGKELGANAFTLPDSSILVTDELLKILTDDQLLAVLLHEVGHIKNNHVLRLVIQSSGVSLFLFTTFGAADLTAIPLILLTQSYSREFETEADTFAAANLRKMGFSPIVLANALYEIEKSRKDEDKKITKFFGKGKIPQFLSSHPLTKDRILRLKKL